MAEQKPIECWMTDMDGVLVHEGRPIPGADALLARLTDNSIHTPRDLRFRLRSSGLEVPEESIWTSAMATAAFLDSQRATAVRTTSCRARPGRAASRRSRRRSV